MSTQDKSTLDKIQDYLAVGGLFNPESMEHDKVRDLLLECRDRLKDQDARLAQARPLIGNLFTFGGPGRVGRLSASNIEVLRAAELWLNGKP